MKTDKLSKADITELGNMMNEVANLRAALAFVAQDGILEIPDSEMERMMLTQELIIDRDILKQATVIGVRTIRGH